MIKKFIILLFITINSFSQSVYKDAAKINDSTDYYLEIGLFNKEEKKSYSKAILYTEKAIDYAFNGKFVLNFYDYLKVRGTRKLEVEEFIESSTASELNSLVMDLDDYLEGGSDEIHKQLREGYGHIPKPQARKIRNSRHKPRPQRE